MKKAIVGVLTALVLAGCGNDGVYVEDDPGTQNSVSVSGNVNSRVSVFTVNTDGRSILCIETDGGYNGGLSCDFETP